VDKNKDITIPIYSKITMSKEFEPNNEENTVEYTLQNNSKFTEKVVLNFIKSKEFDSYKILNKDVRVEGRYIYMNPNKEMKIKIKFYKDR
jgi:hypothetical protein